MLVVSFMFIMVIGVAASQNPAPVKLNFLSFQPTVALSLLLLGAAFLGVALTLVIGWGRELTQRATISSLRQQLKNPEPASPEPEITRLAA